jgi:hypothetical protein
MNWNKLSIVTTLAAALIASPATSYADCGDPGQDPCTGPVPTVDQVVVIMNELMDPGIPAANKGDIVTPAFTQDEAETIDDHLSRMRDLPLNFDITNIQPAPANLAGATVSTTGPFFRSWSPPGILVLADEGGHWKLTHHSAMSATDAYWWNAHRYIASAIK